MRNHLSCLPSDTQWKLCNTELMSCRTVTGHQDVQAHTLNSGIRSQRKSTQNWKLEELYLPDPGMLLAWLVIEKEINHVRQDSYWTPFQGTMLLTKIRHQYEAWKRS